MPDEPAAPEQKINEPATPPKSEDRLGALIAKPDAAAAVLGQITNANAQIEARLSGLEKTLTQLAQTPPSATPAPSSGNQDFGSLFGKPSAPEAAQPAQAGIDPQAIAKLVQGAVQEAVAPIVQRVTADEQRAAKVSKQKASFAKAAASLPALAEQGSDEAQLFDQIYHGMPELAQLDTAPQIIAEMVRGLSVSSRKEDRQTVDRKVQAAAEVPRYGTIEVPDDVGKATELKEKLVEQGSKRGLDLDGLADYMRLQVGTEVAKHQG
jgi:hypothetical protein